MRLPGTGARRLRGGATMRLLVTGVSGLIGSNVAAAAAQQSWSVLGTWRETPVSLLGARTAQLDVSDRHACVTLAEELEPDVVVHAGAPSGEGRLERESRLLEADVLGTENTLAAAHAVRARYALVSCEHVFSGARPSGECWEEEDATEPTTALGRSLLARERLVRDFRGAWLITRPADVYGVNLAIPAAPEIHTPPPHFASPEVHTPPSHFASPEVHTPPSHSASPVPDGERARHVWERSGQPLRWALTLRAGRLLLAPASVRRLADLRVGLRPAPVRADRAGVRGRISHRGTRRPSAASRRCGCWRARSAARWNWCATAPPPCRRRPTPRCATARPASCWATPRSIRSAATA